MDTRREANRRIWDAWTEHHESSAFYDVDGFRAGGTSLREVELRELGGVDGRRLLHLQCHFGLDTLSWARLGARATGVDFAPRAIETARRLNDECGLSAEFVCADVLELALERRFDLVFTSYGVLWWLEDLDRWASTVARHLQPGGALYLVEFHPLLFTLDGSGELVEPYLNDGRSIAEDEQGSYAAPEAPVSGRSFGWHHDLGTIVSAVAGAGLRIEYLREHPASPYDCYPFCEALGPGRWGIRGRVAGALPLLFSLRASLP